MFNNFDLKNLISSTNDIGIDLGTSTVLMYIKGKGVILKEPSVVAVDINTGEVVAVGNKAQKMLGKTPSHILAARPLRDGVISDYDLAAKMLKELLKRVSKSYFIKPKVVISIPSEITEVEKRAVIDAAINAGAGHARVISEPLAAAIGVGIDITKPTGSMVVDIGGGTTDIAVISLEGIVESSSIKTAGDKFDEAIVKYIRKKSNLLIGERTAEELKIGIGCITPRASETYMEVRGRCLLTGLPKTITISSSDIAEAVIETAMIIADETHNVLERTPPELIGDICVNGIILTGGSSLIYGMDTLLNRRTGIKVIVADDPVSCVVRGAGKVLDIISNFQDSSVRKKILY